jgi:2-C-methyl-D-erythritol 4-phosphate cytidylyltransferase
MSDESSSFRCAAVIVAAGSSRRMGFDKLSATLGGMPVLARTVRAFLDAATIDRIAVVCSEERWCLLDGIEFNKPVVRADGGELRQDSVMSGLRCLGPEVVRVAVHDGARPLIAPDEIDRCVAAAAVSGAAALAHRVADTLQRADADGMCTGPVDRADLWSMETPQVFDADVLRDAYRRVVEVGESVTDEVSAAWRCGHAVKFVESRKPNFKITTPADLMLAEGMLNLRS